MPRVEGLVRDRLTSLVDRLWDHRLTLVIAPPGSGKTTLLVQLAAVSQAPVAWYRAETTDTDAGVLMSRLGHAFAGAVGGVKGRWRSAHSAVRELEGLTGRVLLAIDDFHALQDAPAEREMERLITYSPTQLAVLIASRGPVGFNLSRLRVSDHVLEIGSEELRFRSWEVERLFRDIYKEPLTHDDLADVTRRTEGWAAALQLFHLASRGKPAYARRRTLEALSGRSKLLKEYLARNVIEDMPAQTQEFLIETAVLPRLSGPLCDALLGREGSGKELQELERQQMFIEAVGESEYRFHEVFRSYLEDKLLERIGESELRARHREAGRLLEDAGAFPEALHAYCRAEDWKALGHLAGRNGEGVIAEPVVWLELLPPSVLRHDPWLVLGAARRHRAAGRFDDAITNYAEAERSFGGGRGSEVCRKERQALMAWMDPLALPPQDWSGLLRQATVEDPLNVRRVATIQCPGPLGLLTAGIAALLGGDVRRAGPLLAMAEEEPDASPSLSVAARLARGIALLFAGDMRGTVVAEQAADEAERLRLMWLARICRATLAASDRRDGGFEAASTRLAFERAGDLWGASLAGLLEGWGSLRRGAPALVVLRRSADGFHQLGAPVLEAWARTALALGMWRAGDPLARDAASRAEGLARQTAVGGVQSIARATLAAIDTSRASGPEALITEPAEEWSLAIPAVSPTPEDANEPTACQELSAIVVRCFGPFSISIGGVPVDITSAKPRARRTLRLLALHAGRSVHREVLIDSLWPEVDPEAATRSLHVAISTLRRLLDPGHARAGSSLIVREGDAYRLHVPPSARVDVIDFDRALADARATRAGDRARSIAALLHAVELHADELLPEEGPAEWVVPDREQRRAEACQAACSAAEMLLERGDPLSAAQACEQGLRIDRFRDELWRLRILAYKTAGNSAMAAHSENEYSQVLTELGLSSARSPKERRTMHSAPLETYARTQA